MHYVVIEPHRSEYPRPIRFAKGTLLDIGPRYEGEPGWQDWYLCTCAGQEPGWVPAQLIERLSVCQGRALDHYSAHELDVDPGQRVQMVRPLNGWVWCRRQGNGELGWLPAEKVRRVSI
ncbi:SH3 domain-containing protein [Pseudomonas sp. NY11955]|uniref:SH3 domain-containing protein n=1 Tax=Pseudomonas sp. NY11955 TaxID=3400363 RepID=UPI003A83CD42